MSSTQLPTPNFQLSIEARRVIEAAMANATAPAITSSFQAECVVLTHMLREVRPDIPVLFLDTFHHFSQTLAYRDELSARWNLNLINLQAKALECRALAGGEHWKRAASVTRSSRFFSPRRIRHVVHSPSP